MNLEKTTQRDREALYPAIGVNRRLLDEVNKTRSRGKLKKMIKKNLEKGIFKAVCDCPQVDETILLEEILKKSFELDCAHDAYKALAGLQQYDFAWNQLIFYPEPLTIAGYIKAGNNPAKNPAKLDLGSAHDEFLRVAALCASTEDLCNEWSTHRSSKVREYAIRVLSHKLTSKGVDQAMLAHLSDRDPKNSLLAAQAVGSLRHTILIPYLKHWIGDKSLAPGAKGKFNSNKHVKEFVLRSFVRYLNDTQALAKLATLCDLDKEAMMKNIAAELTLQNVAQILAAARSFGVVEELAENARTMVLAKNAQNVRRLWLELLLELEKDLEAIAKHKQLKANAQQGNKKVHGFFSR